MTDGEMHGLAALGTLLLTAALSVPAVVLTAGRADAEPPLRDVEVIEASLAYKADSKPKQPQKPKQPADPETKPLGVSHDETKKADTCKKDADCAKSERCDSSTHTCVADKTKPTDDKDPLSKFHRKEEEGPVGKPDELGSADGDPLGRGNVTKGDPYFQRLWRDLDWSAPELAKSGAVPPIGCVVFSVDGKITKAWFPQKGDDDIATLAETTLRGLKEKRNASPEEVPIHLQQRLTSKGICFSFSAK